MKTSIIFFFVLLTYGNSIAQKGFSIIEKKDQKKVEVRYDGKLLTAYCYFDSTEKPVLFPIKTLSGATVTRGYPVAPRPGERIDHPHHVGLWLNYESVNDLDFWNNSFAIPAERKPRYGSIRHQEILFLKGGKDKGTLRTRSHWVDQQGKVLLNETTDFVFQTNGKTFIIDRTSTLEAVDDEVIFKDVKDGLLGLRVARALEMPSQQEDKFVDAQGNVTTVPVVDNKGVTGQYKSRDGLTGDAVWSSRSPWVSLTGKKNGETMAVVIIDHPQNINYPTYWHARGYGLFAANPLGQKVFDKQKEALNLTLKKGEPHSFRYRVVVHSGSELSDADIDQMMKDFHQ